MCSSSSWLCCMRVFILIAVPDGFRYMPQPQQWLTTVLYPGCVQCGLIFRLQVDRNNRIKIKNTAMQRKAPVLGMAMAIAMCSQLFIISDLGNAPRQKRICKSLAFCNVVFHSRACHDKAFGCSGRRATVSN